MSERKVRRHHYFRIRRRKAKLASISRERDGKEYRRGKVPTEEYDWLRLEAGRIIWGPWCDCDYCEYCRHN